MDANDVRQTIEGDEKYQEGLRVYKDMEALAHQTAEDIAKTMIERIVKKEDKFNISTALMAVAKTLTHLTSYLYDTEEEFLNDVQKARTSVVTDIIPALLDPTPCGICENCKDGKPYECINPKVRGDYTETRFLPLICNMLIEYDMFNKVLHMYALRHESPDGDSSDPKSEGASPQEGGSASPAQKNGEAHDAAF